MPKNWIRRAALPMLPTPLRCLASATALAGALLGSGCATLTTPSTQTLDIQVLDQRDRPLKGITCRAGYITDEADEVRFTAPSKEVVVQRSSTPLAIECRRGLEVAEGTVLPRREGLEQALVPFGSVGVFIDHVTGRMYAYPTILRLRLGQHLRFEHGGEAQATVLGPAGQVIADTAGPAASQTPLPAAAPPARKTAHPAKRPRAAPKAAPSAPAADSAETQPTTTHRTAPLTW
jgi:hypothetical protein